MQRKLLALSTLTTLTLITAGCGEIKPSKSKYFTANVSRSSTLAESDSEFKLAFFSKDNVAILESFNENGQQAWKKEVALPANASGIVLTLLSDNTGLATITLENAMQYALINFDAGSVRVIEIPPEFAMVTSHSAQTDKFRNSAGDKLFIYANLDDPSGDAAQARAAAFSISKDGIFQTEWISSDFYYRSDASGSPFDLYWEAESHARSTGVLADEVLPRGVTSSPNGSARTYLLSNGEKILAMPTTTGRMVYGDQNGLWVTKDYEKVVRINLDGTETPEITCGISNARVDTTPDGERSVVGCKNALYLLDRDGVVLQSATIAAKYGEVDIYRALYVQADGRVLATSNLRTTSYSWGLAFDDSGASGSQEFSLYVTDTETPYHHLISFDGKPQKVFKEPTFSTTIIENPRTEAWEDVSTTAGVCKSITTHIFPSGNALTHSAICDDDQSSDLALFYFDL